MSFVLFCVFPLFIYFISILSASKVIGVFAGSVPDITVNVLVLPRASSYYAMVFYSLPAPAGSSRLICASNTHLSVSPLLSLHTPLNSGSDFLLLVTLSFSSLSIYPNSFPDSMNAPNSHMYLPPPLPLSEAQSRFLLSHFLMQLSKSLLFLLYLFLPLKARSVDKTRQ